MDEHARQWRSTWGGVVVALLGLVIAAPDARAFDLTGTWVGKIACRGRLNGNRDVLTIKPSTLLVSELPTLRLSADGLFYTAIEFPDISDPRRGEVALIRCDTSPVRSGGEFGGEFGRMKVKARPDTGAGTITGTTLRATVAPASTIYTCHWAYKRVDTADPGLDPGCASP